MHDIHSITGFGQAGLLYLRVVVAFGFGWIVFQWHRWKQFLRESAARRWPQVEAAILYGSVSPIPNTNGFEAVLVYSYYVGQYLEGKYSRDFTSESLAQEFVQRVRGKRVPVHYKPSSPSVSVINRIIIDQLATQPESGKEQFS